ncbi:MAG: DNA polymerase I [bacterium]|nr:DNA polymerase I [bacterium]
MQKRLFLVDGTALAYRSFFAFQGSGRAPLSTSDGHPTAATYGFCTTLRALIEREKPDAIALSFDGPRGDLTRTKVYPEYKSTRTKMPDDMAVQLDDIREAATGFGIHIVESEADEADDVIATLAMQGKAEGMAVFLVTGDKDFLQIVDEDIKLWNLRSSTSKPEILDAAACEKKWGVPPALMVDLLALMGDSSDNVPGVPKVGQKTAVTLLQRFGSLEAALDRAEEFEKKAIKASLIENRDQAILSKELVQLRLDVPLPVTATDLGPAAPDPELLRPLFQRLEFTNLTAQLAAAPKPQDDVKQDYRIVRDEAGLDALVTELTKCDRVAIAAQTEGRYPRGTRLVGIAFATAPGQASYVPLNLEPPIVAAGNDAAMAKLRPLLAAERPQKIAHDVKHVLAALRAADTALGGVAFDTMLANYCIEPGVASHSLDALALRHFAYKKTTPKDVVGTGKKQRTFAEIEPSVAGEFVAEEADLALRIAGVLEPLLDEREVRKILTELELPLVPVLLDMEWEGIAIDREHLRSLGEELQVRATQLQQRAHERAGHEFNLGSTQQVGKLLFDELEVHRAANVQRPRKTAAGNYKTDHEVLEKLAPHHEVPQLLLEWRQLTKLKGTYVDTLPQLVDAVTGRVHTTFNQAVAATGRLSSDNPNLQNIPIRTEEGRRVRRAFVPRQKGWVLLSADYSQIELRLLAHLSGDKALVEAFHSGEDIHARTAAIVHGLLPNMVTPELRNQAKIVNYGLMYGMGASRLARETGMRPPEAKKFIKNYFKALPGVKRYLDDSLAHAQDERYAETMFGRRRPLPDIDSTNAMQRIAAENMAVNTPLQGAAADIVKRAMLAVHAALRDRNLEARMLLQVHDELVLDVPESELAEVERIVQDAMTGAAELLVPLEVTMDHGENWLDAH